MKKPRLDPNHPVLSLAVKDLRGAYATTRDHVVMWFRLGDQPWAWRGNDYREQAIRRHEGVYAALLAVSDLPDEALHTRVTNHPYPAHLWAAAFSAQTPDPANPAAVKQLMVATQRRIRETTLSESRTYMGVAIADRRTVDRLRGAANKGRPATRESARLDHRAKAVADVMAREGFNATPLTQGELEWLVHRSAGLHLPPPVVMPAGRQPMTITDMPALVDGVDVDPGPGRDHITLTGLAHRNVAPVTRHVTVLTFGRMEHLDVPAHHEPWVAMSEQLPFPVEWSMRDRLRPGAQAKSEMEDAIALVDDQVNQTRKHGLRMPRQLERVFHRAVEVSDVMSTGRRSEAASYESHWHLAVSGRTPEQVAERVRAVQDLYGNVVEIEQEGGQHALYRSFIPGEPLATISHVHRGPLVTLAAAVPNLASRIGDRRGIYLGHTASTSRRAVVWDPHYGIEILERTGLTPIIGGLGAGKSVLLGLIAYTSAIRGIQTTILDPAGPLSRLCFMPELQRISRHIDLLHSPAGTLSPYTCVPTPARRNVEEDDRLIPFQAAIDEIKESDDEYLIRTAREAYEAKLAELLNDAKRMAERTRMQLATHTLRLLLPPEFRTGSEGRLTRVIIGDAVRKAGGKATSNLTTVLNMIHEDERDAHHEVFNILHDMSEHPQSRLFFGSGHDAAQKIGDLEEPVLLVFTMPGLTLPDPTLDESTWGEEERIAVPLMNLAAHYTSKRIFTKPQKERAVVGLDEAHFLRGIPSGRALVNALGRNSRKLTTRVLLPTQKCADLHGLAAEGLIREAFGGRIDDDQEAGAFLQLVGAPNTPGYRRQLMGLSGGFAATSMDGDAPQANIPREFVMRDAAGNIEVLRVDLGHLPHLFDVLRTRRRLHKPGERVAPLAGFAEPEDLEDTVHNIMSGVAA